MVEIKTGTMRLKTNGILDLLSHLKEKFSSRLAKPVEIKYSGEISGPMAPWPYYSLVIPQKKRFGPIEFGKDDRILMAIFPSIYGLARGRSEMFCSVFGDLPCLLPVFGICIAECLKIVAFIYCISDPTGNLKAF